MSVFDGADGYSGEEPQMRKWLFRGLILSLVLHLGLYFFLRSKDVELFQAGMELPAAPARFVVNKVAIDPKLLEPAKKLEEKKIVLPTQMSAQDTKILQEKPEPKEVLIKPQKPDSPESNTPLGRDKPDIAPVDLDTLLKSAAQSAGKADRNLGAVGAALLDASVKAPRQPVVSVTPGGATGAAGVDGIPGRQSLDDALEKAGSPLGTNQPVAMPGGALFEHDKAELRADAQVALRKVGQLIAFYPGATFLISGHTDWTGTPEYNLRLSERRAEAVKRWLVEAFGIAPDRIETVGRGSAEAVVSADRDLIAQQPNRRVEILIRPGLLPVQPGASPAPGGANPGGGLSLPPPAPLFR
jgi:outer membrane protein OmpA-like peptidoglycan-associated protein